MEATKLKQFNSENGHFVSLLMVNYSRNQSFEINQQIFLPSNGKRGQFRLLLHKIIIF
jgi:hypothetical protein